MSLSDAVAGESMSEETSERQRAPRVVLVCVGRFHHFDLARELSTRGALTRLYTSYPRWKTTDSGIPKDKIQTFPWFQVPYMGLGRYGALREPWQRVLARLDHQMLDRHVAGQLPDCDVVFALSGAGLSSGRAAKSRGMAFVCDRGSSHIRYQDAILRDEYAWWGHRFVGVDPWMIERHEAEYAAADLITVPSEFVSRSFVEMGVPVEKLRTVPYGVDTRRFFKCGEPDRDRFDVLFVGQVGFRKGVPDLLNAFAQVKHPRKRLRLVGSMAPEMREYCQSRRLPEEVEFLGRMPQSDLVTAMSRSSVMVLPSVEEGLALVQAQAIACGCPVIGTYNTGAADLFTDGAEGFIVAPRDPAAIVEKLQLLADDPGMRRQMSEKALQRVASLGGWDTYGDRMFAVLSELVGASASSCTTRVLDS